MAHRILELELSLFFTIIDAKLSGALKSQKTFWIFFFYFLFYLIFFREQFENERKFKKSI